MVCQILVAFPNKDYIMIFRASINAGLANGSKLQINSLIQPALFYLRLPDIQLQ